jgi:hypothetical protein
VVIVFALMPDGEDRDVCRAVDLEKRNVSGRPEGNHEFTQPRAVGAFSGFAAAEWKLPENLQCILDDIDRPRRELDVFVEEKIMEAQQVVPRRARQ